MSAPDAEPQPIKHDCDWDALPPPWCEIGPQFRAECERIARGGLPDHPPSLRPGRPAKRSSYRKSF